MNIDVLVIGRSCLDHIAVVENFPAEDTKVPMIHRIEEAGGQGGTAACCIAGLGARVAYVGKVGNDPEGSFCIQRLRDFGIDTSGVQALSGSKTPVAFILVSGPSGMRTIVYEPSRLPKICGEDIPDQWLAGAPVLLLDPEVTGLADFLSAKSGRKPLVVYDCERWRNGLDRMMSVADFFIPCSDFFGSGEFARSDPADTGPFLRLKQRVKGELIVTCGPAGAVIVEDDRLTRIQAPVVDVKDTIGAGDNFHAAFSLAISRGQTTLSATRFAVAVASLSCRAYGGKAGIPSIEEAHGLSRTLAASVTAIAG